MRILSSILLASIWSTGYAADDCTRINEDSKRLACYDMKYRPVSTVEQASSWEVSETVSKIDDSKTVVLHATSKEVVAKQFGGAIQLTFTFAVPKGQRRCISSWPGTF